MASALLPSSELRYYQTTYGDQYGYNERARKFHRHYGLISSPDDPKFAQGKPVDLATAPLFRRDHFNFRKEYPTHVEYSTQRIARELEATQTARAALIANRPIKRPSTVDPAFTTTREPIYLWRPPVVKSPTAPTTYTEDGTPIAPYINKQHELQAHKQAKQQQQLAIRQQQAARQAHAHSFTPAAHPRESIHASYSSDDMGSTWSRNAGFGTSLLDTQPTSYRQHPSTLARAVDVVQSTASTLRPQTVPSHPLFGMRPVEVSTAFSSTDRATIPGCSTTIHHHTPYHA